MNGSIFEYINLSNIFDRGQKTFGRKFFLQVESPALYAGVTSSLFRFVGKAFISNDLYREIFSWQTPETQFVGIGQLLFYPEFSSLISFSTSNEYTGLERKGSEETVCSLMSRILGAEHIYLWH